MSGLLIGLLHRPLVQGTILDMIEDVSTALQWVMDNVHAYGGDPQRTVVVGQSAGGQLAALAVLFQVYHVPYSRI